jgi:hypothetical protein
MHVHVCVYVNVHMQRSQKFWVKSDRHIIAGRRREAASAGGGLHGVAAASSISKLRNSVF